MTVCGLQVCYLKQPLKISSYQGWVGGFGGEGMMLGPGVAKQLAVCIRTEIDSTLCTTREKSKASELLVDMNPCRTNGVRRTTEV